MRHKPVKQHEFYKVEGGELRRERKVCTRCGDGTFMAEHKNRWYCGRCGMTIWKKKDEKAEEKKAAKESVDEKETVGEVPKERKK